MGKNVHSLQAFCVILLLYLFMPEFAVAQYIIGQETVDMVTQRVESGKEGRDALFMMDRDDLKPGGLYLFRLSIRGNHKPELEVSFDKTSYKEGDEITMTIERKTANRRIVIHPRTGEEIDEGIGWEKLPVWGSLIRHAEIKGATPDENGTIWLEEGESFTAKTVWKKGRSSDTFRITMAAGNVNFGESRSYVLVRKQHSDSGMDQKKKNSLDSYNDDPQMMQSSIPSSFTIGCFASCTVS